MKRNKIALILTSFVLALSVGTFISVKNTNNEAKVAFATYTNGDGATYYNSIDDSKSGNALLTDLRSLNLSKRKSTSNCRRRINFFLESLLFSTLEYLLPPITFL